MLVECFVFISALSVFGAVAIPVPYDYYTATTMATTASTPMNVVKSERVPSPTFRFRFKRHAGEILSSFLTGIAQGLAEAQQNNRQRPATDYETAPNRPGSWGDRDHRHDYEQGPGMQPGYYQQPMVPANVRPGYGRPVAIPSNVAPGYSRPIASPPGPNMMSPVMQPEQPYLQMGRPPITQMRPTIPVRPTVAPPRRPSVGVNPDIDLTPGEDYLLPQPEFNSQRPQSGPITSSTDVEESVLPATPNIKEYEISI